MTRTEKIDLVRSGKYIIENDMKGNNKVNKLLKSINEFLDWSNSWDFYEINSRDDFNALFNTELNDRPRFKMSELVEVEEPTEQKQFITRDELKRLWLNFTFTELATKINQMAFEAYSKAKKF